MRLVHLVLVIICLQAAVDCEWCYVCSDNEGQVLFYEFSGWGGEEFGKCSKIRSNPPVWCPYGCMRQVVEAGILVFGRKIDTASCAEEELNLKRPTFLERMKGTIRATCDGINVEHKNDWFELNMQGKKCQCVGDYCNDPDKPS
ncbi:unnamed protein product [Bursaphelenchus xylophilus]|uniref:(pine wood nematode) hypothetical protein n=1 Tax=Bursaphelenchus xylophilus TaxID=6326 RepID=A0A1I7S8C8_BURXY|nr:unnamed protein product [Bursaphelenchus xylophilus]CAG9120967.1 unnamed protein product [Bursaphelenchus xylophilus]